MRKFEDLSSESFLNILSKYFTADYITTWRRRFNNKDVKIYSAIKEIYRNKGIDLRMDILELRFKSNTIDTFYYRQAKNSIKSSRAIHDKIK